MSRVAIIGGTGLDSLSLFNKEMKSMDTEYGRVYYRECDDVIYLPRHSVNHTLPPSKVNYKANIKCLEKLGVERVISIYAVGSITERLKPLEWGIISDFMDFSGRDCTFFTGGEAGVRHVDMSHPFDECLQKALSRKKPDRENLIYVTTNGPRLETKAEIKAFKLLGGDVVGMTLSQEATLLREVGIANASIAYSINWAAGIGGASVSFCSDQDIDKLMSKILLIAKEVLSDR